MIRLRDVRKTYRLGGEPVHALAGVSLDIGPGEFVAVMGPSGSGKSTLMHVLGLLDVPDSGDYELLGRTVKGLSEDELAAFRSRSVGFVFQQFNLLARTSAEENVALPLLYSGDGMDAEKPRRLLREVGLGNRMDHTPSQLSGGQQQRVAIARSLVNDPALLLADEPTGNLDSHSETEIIKLLQGLNEKGITVVLVTHEDEIGRHAKRIIRMRDGAVVSDEQVDKGSHAPRSTVHGKGPAVDSGRLSAVTSHWAREARSHFRQAARALLANKVRTGLSMLGILIGVAAVIAMLALGQGARQSIEQRLASMGSNLLMLQPGATRVGGVTQESGAGTRMTVEDAAAIREEVLHVTRTAPTVDGRGQVAWGGKNWNSFVIGTTPDYEGMRAAKPMAGRFFTVEEDRARARVALVGVTVVRELFGESNPLGESVKINRVNFQVIGVLPEKGSGGWRDQDDVVVMPIQTAMRRVFGQDEVEDIDIEVDSPDNMEGVQAAVTDLMVRRHRVPPSRREDAFRIRNLQEMQDALQQTSRTMAMLLASIAAISLLVGGIGIMNIMLVSVTERTREIGLRKALGARPKDILWQFLIEALLVSVCGGCAGIALGWAITFVLSTFAGWAATVSPSAVLLAFLFSTGVGLVFGLWPARQASKLNPIQALRYE
jgi:macrolide transport system ATP-binding/permease protein